MIQQAEEIQFFNFGRLELGGFEHRRIQIRQSAVEIGKRVSIGRFGQYLSTETLLRHHPTQEIECVQAITRGARGNKCGKIPIEFLFLCFLSLDIARDLAGDRGQQTPIALIEALTQSQQQDPDCSTFMGEWDRCSLEGVDCSGGGECDLLLLQRAVAKLHELPPNRIASALDQTV